MANYWEWLVSVFSSQVRYPFQLGGGRRSGSTFRSRQAQVIKVFSLGKKKKNSWKEFSLLPKLLPSNANMTDIFIAFTDGLWRKEEKMSWDHRDDLGLWQNPKLKAWNPWIHLLFTTSHYIFSFSQTESKREMLSDGCIEISFTYLSDVSHLFTLLICKSPSCPRSFLHCQLASV